MATLAKVGSSTRGRAMILHEEEAERNRIINFMRKLKFQPEWYHSPGGALNAFQFHRSFKVVVSSYSIKVPEMNGVEFFRKLADMAEQERIILPRFVLVKKSRTPVWDLKIKTEVARLVDAPVTLDDLSRAVSRDPITIGGPARAVRG